MRMQQRENENEFVCANSERRLCSGEWEKFKWPDKKKKLIIGFLEEESRGLWLNENIKWPEERINNIVIVSDTQQNS